MITRAGFVAFIRAAKIYTETGFITVSTSALADNSTDIDKAYARAEATVLKTINQLNTLDYEDAVYNLGMDYLIRLSNATVFDPLKDAKFYGLKTGFVQSVSDEGTSTSYQLNGWLGEMDMSSVALTKTQFGRTYLEIVSRYSGLIGFGVG